MYSTQCYIKRGSTVYILGKCVFFLELTNWTLVEMTIENFCLKKQKLWVKLKTRRSEYVPWVRLSYFKNTYLRKLLSTDFVACKNKYVVSALKRAYVS